VPSNETTEIIARGAFLKALRDRELALKVLEREPKTLDEAYRTALRLEAYQHTAERDDFRKPAHRVRGTTERTEVDGISDRLDQFLKKQNEMQLRWQTEMEAKISRRLEGLQPLSFGGQTGDGTPPPSGTDNRPPLSCYGCGRPGHLVRNCRQNQRNRHGPPNSREREPQHAEAGREEEVATNHTTRPKTRIRSQPGASRRRGRYAIAIQS